MPKGAKIILLESKADLLKESLEEREKELKLFAFKNGLLDAFLVSSKTGYNIKEAFERMMKEIDKGKFPNDYKEEKDNTEEEMKALIKDEKQKKIIIQFNNKKYKYLTEKETTVLGLLMKTILSEEGENIYKEFEFIKVELNGKEIDLNSEVGKYPSDSVFIIKTKKNKFKIDDIDI